MKKSIIVAGLAAALATTSFAGSAMARPDYWYRHHHYRHHHDDNIGPAIIAGSIFGLIGGALANNYYSQPNPYYGRPYYGANAHVRWCEQRYRTYNPATDMFYARPGVKEYCHSPYD